MIRIIAFLGALGGAAMASQYPAFSQQYLQRLAGQVDALEGVVADFDRSALAAGLTRGDALAQLRGTDFLTARQADMRATFARHARLSEALADLRATGPVARLTMPHRMGDAVTLQAAWADFQPALPLTAPGAICAGAGFLGGWGLTAMLATLLTVPFRRRRSLA